MVLAQSSLATLLLFVSSAVGDVGTLKAVIDGYTASSTLNSPATLPLGTTLILVCRLSGIPHGQQTTYTWTCPNSPCQQAGTKITNNIVAVNITSTSDGGTYTCTATSGGMEASQEFQLNVTGGEVLYSHGRIISHERVITDRNQLQPPNNDNGDGRIECTVSSGQASFSYSGHVVSNPAPHQATAIIPVSDFSNFMNFEGQCDDIYHYVFISHDSLPDVTITGTSSTANSTTVNIGTIPDGVDRVIIGYDRLDLGQPVVGQYENINKRSSISFSSLVPGAKYRITAWGLGGGSDRRRSHSPAVVEVTTNQTNPSPPRDLTVTTVFQHGIELNWIPPRETNGDIQHYIIYTTQNGIDCEQEINTTDNTNYYNLTGLEIGRTYNITVVAVNSAGMSERSGTIYTHRTMETTVVSATSTTPSEAITMTTPSTPADIATTTTHSTPADIITMTTSSTPTDIFVTVTTSSTPADIVTMTTPSTPADIVTMVTPTTPSDTVTPSPSSTPTSSSISSSCVDIPVIIAVSVANILILLVTITLVVIGGVLTCKRRRHTHDKVHFDNMHSKEVMEIYDQVDDSIVLKRMAEDYQYVDVRTTKEEDEHEQASTQLYI